MNWQWLRLKWMDLFCRRKLHQELDEEIQAHIDIDIQQKIAQCDSPKTARAKALKGQLPVDFCAYFFPPR